MKRVLSVFILVLVTAGCTASKDEAESSFTELIQESSLKTPECSEVESLPTTGCFDDRPMSIEIPTKHSIDKPTHQYMKPAN